MITLIIRDDDINYFTPEWILEKIYGECWRNNIPVCFSVIPSVLSQKGYHLGYHPFIPNKYVATNQKYPIYSNATLCNYLNDKIKNGLVEICIHGLEHSLDGGASEFSINKRIGVQEKITVGKNILQKGIPLAEIETFVPPFDKISAMAIQAILDEGLNISMRLSLSNLGFFYSLPAKHSLLFFKNLFQDRYSSQVIKVKRSKIFLHRGYWFSRLFNDHKKTGYNFNSLFDNPQRYNLSNKIFVIVNHHWEFFDREQKYETQIFELWNKFIHTVLQFKEKIKFSTFNKCHL